MVVFWGLFHYNTEVFSNTMNDEQSKRILILYTSVGLGHKSMAENIGAVLSQAGCVVKLEDVLKVQEGKLVDFGTGLHKFINTHLPGLWSFLYQSEWVNRVTSPWRVRVASKNYENLKAVIDGFMPDTVIATQTTASALVEYLKVKKLYRGTFGIAFSDFHLHPFWLYPHADFYLANIPQQKEEMVKLGIPADRVHVCGMTLADCPPIDKEHVRQKLGIKPDEKVILAGSGSLGTGFDESVLRDLVALPSTRVIVVCGKNAGAFQHLNSVLEGTSAVVLGFYSPMCELYSIADIFISKPGGLSTTEALSFKLPILVSHMLPGQEELNYTYLVEKGLVMPEPINIAAEAAEELMTGKFREQLKENTNIAEVLGDRKVLVESVMNATVKK